MLARLSPGLQNYGRYIMQVPIPPEEQLPRQTHEVNMEAAPVVVNPEQQDATMIESVHFNPTRVVQAAQRLLSSQRLPEGVDMLALEQFVDRFVTVFTGLDASPDEVTLRDTEVIRMSLRGLMTSQIVEKVWGVTWNDLALSERKSKGNMINKIRASFAPTIHKSPDYKPVKVRNMLNAHLSGKPDAVPMPLSKSMRQLQAIAPLSWEGLEVIKPWLERGLPDLDGRQVRLLGTYLIKKTEITANEEELGKVTTALGQKITEAQALRQAHASQGFKNALSIHPEEVSLLKKLIEYENVLPNTAFAQLISEKDHKLSRDEIAKLQADITLAVRRIIVMLIPDPTPANKSK
jgi:hypothetical protein